MLDPQENELALYQTNHREWLRQHAPRIAAVLSAMDDDEHLLNSWSMLRSDTKEAVWEHLTKGMRERTKALCKARPSSAETP